MPSSAHTFTMIDMVDGTSRCELRAQAEGGVVHVIDLSRVTAMGFRRNLLDGRYEIGYAWDGRTNNGDPLYIGNSDVVHDLLFNWLLNRPSMLGGMGLSQLPSPRYAGVVGMGFGFDPVSRMFAVALTYQDGRNNARSRPMVRGDALSMLLESWTGTH